MHLLGECRCHKKDCVPHHQEKKEEEEEKNHTHKKAKGSHCSVYEK